MHQTLYQILCSSFCVIVVLSNIISAKMVSLPFFTDFSIPAGLITYPLTFLLSDLVTEFYGTAKAKFMVYMAFGMCILSFVLIQFTLVLPSPSSENFKAFEAILGLSSLRILSSLIAYLTAQIADVQLYALIKSWTGERHLWLRNNGSTCISQIIDTVTIDIIYLYGGLGMTMSEVAPIMLFSYLYKAFFSIANTPLFYLCVHSLRKRPLFSSI